jgi:hypothetical protein
MEIHEGKFTTSNSDLYIIIFAVHYQDCSYAKVKMALINKSNGIVYEAKNAKIHKKNITNWEVYNGTESNT